MTNENVGTPRHPGVDGALIGSVLATHYGQRAEDGYLSLEPGGRFSCRAVGRPRYGGERRTWLVAGALERSGGVTGPLILRRLTVEAPAGAGYGVDDNALRDVKVGQLLATLAARMKMIDGATREAYSKVFDKDAKWDAPEIRHGVRSRSTARDEYLRDFAEAYLNEQVTGRGLHARLGERFPDDRGNPLPLGTVKDHIRAATDAGWLSEPPSPRARFREPGERLLAWRFAFPYTTSQEGDSDGRS